MEDIIRELKPLEVNSLLHEEKVQFLYIDVDKTSFFKKHYDLGEGQYFYFFVRNQIFKFEEFQSLFESETLRKKTIEFLTKVINTVTEEVTSINEIEILLNEKQIIGLYLGEKGKSYQRFYDLAIKNVKFDFYYSFDKTLKENVFQKYNDKIAPESDVFVILRSRNLINEFDSLQLVSFDKFYSTYNLNKFFEFERYPKLRDCFYNKLNVEEIFYKRHFLLIYITPEKDDGKKKWEFEKAIQFLPKRMIYSRCHMDSEDINHYLHLFMLASSSFTPGGLYSIYVSPSQNIQVQQFTNEFNSKTISHFVFDVYERNKYFFNDPNEEENKKKFENDELQLFNMNCILEIKLFTFLIN